MRAVYSPYLLQKKIKLNSLSQLSYQQGAILKVIEGENWGVADICPKPELGDDSLENEFKHKGLLYTRATELAIEDMQARREKTSLLENKFVKNNFLIIDYKAIDLNQARYSNHTVKIKGDREITVLSRILNALVNDVLVRLDFNSVLSVDEYENFIKLLSPEAINKIEYVEDPTRFNIKWKNWNLIIPLAFDFQAVEYNSDFAKYLVIKPARQKVLRELSNYTLTSAMDHPVGIAHGLRIAQKLARNDSGFLTLDLFENGAFNKYFEQKENYLNFSFAALNDYGIGMSEELHKLKWIDL